jgi:cell shape-determining protein MreC
MDSVNRYQAAKNFALSVAVCLVLIGFDFSIGLKPLRGILEKIIVSPLTKIEQVFTVAREPYHWWLHVRQGAEHIARLETLLAAQTLDREKLRTLEAENEFLRSQAHITQAKPGIIAALTVHGSSVWLRSGVNQGVSEGMWVLGDANALIGRVSKSGRGVSLIETPSNTTFRLPAATSQDSAHGIVVGDGVATHLTNIAQGDEIAIGDTVVSVGGEQNVPAQMVIGVVSEIIGSEAQAIKKARLEVIAKPKTGMIVKVE